MEGLYNYGEIHLLTERVFIDAIDIKNKNKTPQVLHKKPVSNMSLSLNTHLRQVGDLYTTWWPCRLFNGMQLGSILCGCSRLIVSLDVAIIAMNTYNVFEEYSEGYLIVPWWQVILHAIAP
jgi:hypothetical protein